MNTQLQDRLAALRIDVDAATAERQLSAVAAALDEPAADAPAPRRTWRHRIAPIAAALSLFGAPVAAIAAESSVPGDLLYPVKQITEGVRSWFDPDIAVDHRLDELEAVLERDVLPGVVTDRLEAADRAVSDLATDHHRADEYRRRLDEARDQVRHLDGSDREPSSESPSDRTGDAVTRDQRIDPVTTTTEAHRDGAREPATTTTTRGTDPDRRTGNDNDEPVRDATTTTTPGNRDADHGSGDRSDRSG